MRRGVVGAAGGMRARRVVVFAPEEAHARTVGVPGRRPNQRRNNAYGVLARQCHRARSIAARTCAGRARTARFWSLRAAANP